ncbi:MAG: ATP-binding protein [Myxococcota bacterium]|nr:ATP-binding protein [Myxococcota bacterium]
MKSQPSLDELLACVPQAFARLDASGRVCWLSPGFEQRLGFSPRLGAPVEDCLAPGPARDEVLRKVRGREAVRLTAVAASLVRVRLTLHPSAEGMLIALERDVDEEQDLFAQALQEISRAVGETLDVDAACAAAVVSMVRSTQLARAEVFLRRADPPGGLRKVATSTLTAEPPSADLGLDRHDSVLMAMASGQPQIGVGAGVLFAAIPVMAQRRPLGVLVLFKAQGAGFGIRELDLWASAAGHLAVAVENGRLYHEVQAALQIREDFMSIASHELKTPLTALKLGLHAIERRVGQGQPLDLAPVLKCKRQVDRLAALVTDLLDATRVDRGRLTVDRGPLELSRVVQEVVEEFRGHRERTIELQLPDRRVQVLGDRERISQVLQNLIENALKYSPLESTVRVRVTVGDGQARIWVQDQGIGIPVSDQERVFERFYRAKNSSARNFGGLGLGLFICRSVLELHHGSLQVTSEEGSGSTFMAQLPLLSESETAALRRRVLVVDEDPDLRASAGDTLGLAGFDVLEARDAVDALARLAQIDVDVVLASATLQERPAEVLRDALLGALGTHPISLIVTGARLPGWAEASTPLCARPFDSHQLLQAVGAAISARESAGS